MDRTEGDETAAQADAIVAARDVYGDFFSRPLLNLNDRVTLGTPEEGVRVVVCPRCESDRGFGLSYVGRFTCLRCGHEFHDDGLDPRLAAQLVKQTIGNRDWPIHGGLTIEHGENGQVLIHPGTRGGPNATK
ncbi:hypothetical protein ACWEHA_09510 [Amycolatopsis nivea]